MSPLENRSPSTKPDCERLVAALRGTKQVLAAIFNQRTDPYYLKLREMIRTDELGTMCRINWIATQWFRTTVCYAFEQLEGHLGRRGAGLAQSKPAST